MSGGAPGSTGLKRAAGPRAHSSRSLGLRLTKVGFWFVLLLVVILLAASNTGNNGLYLVLATMGGVFLVSHPLAAGNLKRLQLALVAPDEIFVHQPTRLALAVRNGNRWLPKFLLVCGIAQSSASRASDGPRGSTPMLIGYLRARADRTVDVEMIARRRGRWQPDSVAVSSLFPFGFFHKARRYDVPIQVIVYPEIFAPGGSQPMREGRQGNEPSRRRGSGQELHALRPFRQGDDPRAIHWKQTARTGNMIVQEREAEENRRLSIVFDNATRDLDPERAERFERLVSEAATNALDALDRGFEVELVTRDGVVPFGAGLRQRREVLETLALIASVAPPKDGSPLVPSSPSVPHLRLAIEDERSNAPSADSNETTGSPSSTREREMVST